jgi:serine/threonine-protein kinase
VAAHSGARQIYLRALDSLEGKAVPGTEGAVSPFFSPDGQWLGFFSGSNMKKIPLSGGAPLKLSIANASNSFGASWSSQGTIAFAQNAGALQQVAATGGTAQPLTRLAVEKGETMHSWPDFLPGGEAVLFTIGPNRPRIAVQSLRSGEERDLALDGSLPQYAASGHLLYAQSGNVMAVGFDPQRLQLTGAAVPVVQGVLQLTSGAAQYSVSTTGSLVYVAGTEQGAERQLVWLSRNGTEEILPAPSRNYVYPRLAPDGRRLAVGIREQGSQIWLYDTGRDTLTRVTFGGTGNDNPTWTPDGKRLAYVGGKQFPPNIYWQLADGSGGVDRLTTEQYASVPSAFSSDGQLLAFVEIDPTSGYDIWVLRLSDGKAQPFLRTPGYESAPRFSPDGHWLAYVSDESGRFEIYVQPYPGPGGKYQISTDGGTEPVWNPKGKELFYRSGDKMMAVDITTQPGLSVGKPKMLFQGPYVPTLGTLPFYDVSPDGERFLMLKPSEQTASLTQIVVVQNWFEELKRLVPSGK